MAGTIKKLSATEVEVQFLPGGLPHTRTVSEMTRDRDIWKKRIDEQQAEHDRLAGLANPTEQETADRLSLQEEVKISIVNRDFYQTLLNKTEEIAIGETGQTGDI